MYEYMLVKSKSMGYAMYFRANGFWQQCTKWYWYLGNLKRYNKCANNPCLYKIID